MFSLQRFLSRGDRFFDLLDASAEEARESVQALWNLLHAPDDQQAMDRLMTLRRQEKKLTKEISSLLCTSFITPLEREDIETLSHALARIPKAINKFAERFVLTQSQLPNHGFEEQAQLLKQATDTLHEMVSLLRHGPRLDKTQELNGRLHSYESAADELILALLRELYGGKFEPLPMIVLRDLYELLEKVIDRCRAAGDAVFQIVLKNS